MENHHFQWENALEIANSNSYVQLPGGTVYPILSHFFLIPECHVGHAPTFRQSHILKKQVRLAEKSAETSPRTIMALATAVIAVACSNVF